MVDTVDPTRISSTLNGRPCLVITVLADPAGQAFDCETGNASADRVAQAMVERFDRGEWSIGYVNWSTFHGLDVAVARLGHKWAGAAAWPAAGLYLWPADPSANIAAGRWVLPAEPVAVQDRYPGGIDLSRTASNFPAVAAGYLDGPVSAWPPSAWARFTRLADKPSPVPSPPSPPPPPPPPPPPSSEVDVRLPVLAEGSRNASVGVVQTLIGGTAVDGVFGPLTRQRVVDWQRTHRLAADGVVGLHTWGALLGAPQ
jgi:peptidoglycan hydrolase-like protein with peptidoglycan-binding domain